MPPEVAAALRKENQTLRQQVIQLESLLRDKGQSTKSGTSNREIRTKSLTRNSSAADNTATPLADNTELVVNLRTHISSLQCKVEHLKEQVTRSTQDALEVSLQADRSKLQFEELKSFAKTKGVELTTSPQHPEGNVDTSLSIVEKLREEVAEWKAREAEARIDAEVARVTAASVIKTGGGDLPSVEDVILQTIDSDQQSDNEDIESEEKALLAAELLTVNGSIEQKEEIFKKALLEKQCMEAMKSHFEGVLESLQSEVETLSAEREDLLARVDDAPDDDKASSGQMKTRIRNLEDRIAELQAKSREHKKSLRLREMAEKRVAKLELDIQNDKKRKADLQKRLKEESSERRKDKKNARLEAARLMKDSQRLKCELQKVKASAERQAMVLRRKSAELANKQKRQQAIEHRKKKQGNAKHQKLEISSSRRVELISWLDSEMQAFLDTVSTDDHIVEQELLLEETQQKLKCLESKGNQTAAKALQEEVKTRGIILDQLRTNLKTLQESSLKDPASLKGMSQSEITFIVKTSLERLTSLQHEGSKNRDEMINKAVASARTEERQKAEESLLRVRLEHSEAMSNLLDSTRQVLENEMNQQFTESSPMNKYLREADLAVAGIKTQIDEVKLQRDGMKSAVDRLAKDIISNSEVKTEAKKKKPKRKESFEEFISLDESFVIEDLDDGNDSDWSPDDEKPFKKKRSLPSNAMLDERNAAKENLPAEAVGNVIVSADSLDSLKVSDLKERLREYGLKLSGKKDELKSRLNDYLIMQKGKESTPEQTSIGAKTPKQSQSRKPLRAVDNNVNVSFMQDNSSFSSKRRRIKSNPTKERRKRNMNDAVNNAMKELAML